jgi:hypothetical protein
MRLDLSRDACKPALLTRNKRVIFNSNKWLNYDYNDDDDDDDDDEFCFALPT